MVPRENLEESVVRNNTRDLPVSMPQNFCKFKKNGREFQFVFLVLFQIIIYYQREGFFHDLRIDK